jgi:uncharacterized Fe-S radical SAM superfamily protein PflX
MDSENVKCKELGLASLLSPVLKLWPLLSRCQLLEVHFIIIHVVLRKITRRHSKISLLQRTFRRQQPTGDMALVQMSVTVFHDKCTLSCVFMCNSVHPLTESAQM